ncbi:hypothetical protein Tco_0702537 [Tanacetum coccineum]|uniref:Uncharacterized protein n=1 Tax=Tanacetum coccineum TaxID=301880 RepID=A0ABQ4XX42_9ASTR
MKTKDTKYKNTKTNVAPRHVPLPGGGLEFQNTSKKRKSDLSPLARAFDTNTRAQLDQEIARMFYTGGLSFNLARNPYNMKAFTFAANQNLGGYVLVRYNKLRTNLIQQEKANVEWLNLALKNICAAKNTENNSEVYIGSPKFMEKSFKLVKRALEAMVTSDEWASYREDDQDKARFIRDKVLNEYWWDQVNYILNFTAPIYDMIRACDINKSSLHLVYEMWDSMIKKVSPTDVAQIFTNGNRECLHEAMMSLTGLDEVVIVRILV